MDFDEHEDQEAADDMGLPIPTPNYDSLTNSATAQQPPPAAAHHRRPVRYRECLKNHAVSIGGHAVDGCGEFIAAGEEGTLDALKCAACNCHRNFHRKEAEGGRQQQHQPQFSSYYRPPPPAGYLHLQSMPPHQPLALPAASGGVGGGGGDEDASNPSSSGGFSGGSKKRFRTKFTAEQKEKMLEFAERLGWRIQKHDESAVAQFCAETGVKRQVLKVWMHNNKNTVVGMVNLQKHSEKLQNEVINENAEKLVKMGHEEIRRRWEVGGRVNNEMFPDERLPVGIQTKKKLS